MLRFVDGFDHYQSLNQKWDLVVSAGNPNVQPQISPVGRNGGGAFVCPTGGTNAATYCQKNIANAATYFVGFAYQYLPASALDMILIAFQDGGTTQVDLRITSSGHLYFTRNGTVLGSASVSALSFGAYHYLEIFVTVDPTVGVAKLNVDGSNTGWLNLTGQNTRATANSQIGSVLLGMINPSTGSNFPGARYDDFYLADTTGSFNNAFLGDVKVQGLMPTGNGTLNQYTQNEASWVASTVSRIGQMIKDSNGNLQVITAVTSDAKTGSVAPTWATGTGATTTDNHVTWTCLGPSSQFKDVNQNPPAGSAMRMPSTAYVVGNAVWDSNNNLQLCTTAGTSAGATTQNVSWNVTVGGTTSDGGVVWTNVGNPDDTYLSDATVGDISRFTFPTLSGTTVNAVSVTMRARKDDASVRSIRGCTLSNGTTGDNGTDLVMSTSSQMVEGIMESDPHTGVAWTVAGVNAAEFGVKTTA